MYLKLTGTSTERVKGWLWKMFRSRSQDMIDSYKAVAVPLTGSPCLFSFIFSSVIFGEKGPSIFIRRYHYGTCWSNFHNSWNQTRKKSMNSCLIIYFYNNFPCCRQFFVSDFEINFTHFYLLMCFDYIER